MRYFLIAKNHMPEAMQLLTPYPPPAPYLHQPQENPGILLRRLEHLGMRFHAQKRFDEDPTPTWAPSGWDTIEAASFHGTMNSDPSSSAH